MNLKKFPHQELTKQIIGIYYHVYNELGYGFLEKVYHNAFVIELLSRGFKIEKHKKVNVFYKNVIVGEYVPDILVEDKLIIELNDTIADTREFCESCDLYEDNYKTCIDENAKMDLFKSLKYNGTSCACLNKALSVPSFL